MGMSKEEAHSLLKNHGLRVTAPRLAVLRALAETTRPVSHTEMLALLEGGSWDQATVYRNLVKLREVGIAAVVSHAEGLDRYSLAGEGGSGHRHPHFMCTACGQVKCLPDEVVPLPVSDEVWARSLKGASLQFSGECPDCIAR